MNRKSFAVVFPGPNLLATHCWQFDLTWCIDRDVVDLGAEIQHLQIDGLVARCV